MKQALIVYGGWDGHYPQEISEVFQEILEAEGFQVKISQDLSAYDDGERLKQMDIIVPHWTMGQIDAEKVKNVCEAVAGGVGLCGCHGGMCDAFRESTEWQFMTGAQWVAHPGNDQVEYEVKLCPDSIFTKGLQDFSLKSEQYYMHVDPAVTVHAITRFPVADGPHAANGTVDMPVVFTKKWGKGKIFYTSLGHTHKVFEIPQARELMRRGFVWAAERSNET